MAVSALWTQAIGLVGIILLARILDLENFGQYGLLQATLLTLGALVSNSITVTVAKFVSQYKSQDKARAGRICGLCWVLSFVFGVMVVVGMQLFADVLAGWVGDAALESYLKIAAISVVFSSLMAVQHGMMLAFEQLRWLALNTMLVALLNLIVLPLVCLQYGLLGVTWGLVATSALGWLIGSLMLRRCLQKTQVVLSFQKPLGTFSVLWRFTLPHFISAFLQMPVSWFCLTLLAREDRGIEAVAIFVTIEKWRQVILFLPAAISKPSIPILAESFGLGDYGRVKKVLLGMLGINTGVCALVTLGLLVLTPVILGFYGEFFREHGVHAMWVFLAAAFVQSIMVPLGDVLATAGRTWFSLGGASLRAVVLIGASLVGVAYGAVGLAGAYLLASAVTLIFLTCVTFWIIHKKRAI